MPPSEYERFRQRLEQQLRTDVELLFEAYRTKLRAFETVARARGELDPRADPRPALEIPANLLPAPQAAPTGAAPSPAPAAASPPAPAPGTAPRPRAVAYEVQDAVEDALLRVGEVFDRRDLCRAMGFEPRRSTLFRVLTDLQLQGVIAIHEIGAGRTLTRYRKSAPAPREPDAGDGSRDGDAGSRSAGEGGRGDGTGS